ncbi:hypothetical protein [Microbacterium sp. A94]|uniref:hypothetical protein n=1 Tax=Microbacterium sp. A94 TaxID=3450717 RepID=UPI003F42BDA1
MTAADLALYVSPDMPLSEASSAYAGECWEEAEALISQHVGAASVPAVVLKRATLEVGSELYHRRKAPNGIAQFATPEASSPARIARDPLVGAYPLLAPWLGRGIA